MAIRHQHNLELFRRGLGSTEARDDAMRWPILLIGAAIFLAGPAAADPQTSALCRPIQGEWNSVAGGTDLAAMDREIAKIPPLRATLKAQAQRRRAQVANRREHPQPVPVMHEAPPAPSRPPEPVPRRPSQPQPGTVFQDVPDAPEMVVIPPGAFTMGSPASEPGRGNYEAPQHRVTIGYALAVGEYDVTRDQFAAFATATGYSADASCDWRKQSATDPVVCVGFDDANAYLAWLSRKTGHTYRLLSEAEYEYAARAGTTTAYWWGDDIGTNRANCRGCGSRWDFTQVSPVGSFQANPFGLYDMSGDVWSWTADCFAVDYGATPADGSANASGDCGLRVIRGGSFIYDPRGLRSANRLAESPGDRSWERGFRVARTL